MRHDIGHKRQSIALVGTLNSGKTILALKLLPVEVKLPIYSLFKLEIILYQYDTFILEIWGSTL